MAIRTITGVKKGTSDLVGTVVSPGNVEISATDSATTEIGSVVAAVIVIADSTVNANGAFLENLLAEGTTDVLVKDTLGATVGAIISGEVIIADSSITFNTIAMDTLQSEETGVFEVVDQADGTTPVGSKLSDSKWQVNVLGSAIDITLNAILMRTTLANTIINVYLFGTTDAIGTGVFNADWFINVRDSGATTEIGTAVTGNVIIADSVETIKDSFGTTLYTNSILAEGTDEQIISDSVQTITDSAANTLYTINLLAEGIDTQAIADSTAVVRRSDATTIISEPILAEASENIDISDSNVVLKKSNGTTTLRSVPVKADDSIDETIELATVNVQKSDAVLIQAQTVEAEDTVASIVADSPVTFNTVAMDAIKATDTGPYEIVDAADGTTLVGSKLSGTKWEVTLSGTTTIAYCRPQVRQTVAFLGETLGQGQLFQNGVYNDNTVGIKPIKDGTFPWYKLDIITVGSLPNIWGHEWIWAGETGGYVDDTGAYFDVLGVSTTKALAFPNDYVVNHFNGLAYPLSTPDSTTRTQVLSEAEADSLVHNGFSDWRLCHPGEIEPCFQRDGGAPGSNDVFSLLTDLWTNETNSLNTAQGSYLQVSTGMVNPREAKTTVERYFPCRTAL